MIAAYFGVILVCRVIQTVFVKKISGGIESAKALFRYYSLQNTLSALFGLLFLLFSGEKLRLNGATALYALLFAAALFTTQYSAVKAIRLGTISLYSMSGTAGMIVPVLAGALFFGDRVSPMQILSLAVFFLAMWQLIAATKQSTVSFDLRSVVYLLIGLLSNGATMLVQQLFSKTVTDGSVTVFSLLSFAFLAAFMGVTSLFLKDGEGEAAPAYAPPLLSALLLAAALFVINQLSTILAAFVSPILLFAFLSGGGTVISVVVAAVVFREKMNVRIAISVAVGIAALIGLKIFVP